MWNRDDVVKQCIVELNCENEEQAKSVIKSILKQIINQQKIISEANNQIAKLQEDIKSINISPVNL